MTIWCYMVILVMYDHFHGTKSLFCLMEHKFPAVNKKCPQHCTKGLSTREAGRGHATPHMPVETAKCWWLLKIEPNAWAGGKGSCAVCVDLQAVGALEFFGELCSLAKGFGPIIEGVWAGFREREGSIFSNHQHFAVSTGICGVACPLPASRVDKPLIVLSKPVPL